MSLGTAAASRCGEAEPVNIVRCLWRDAYFDYEGDGFPVTDYLVVTVGHLVEPEEPTSFVSIAAEELPDGRYRAITHVPRESVVELAPMEA